MSLFKFFKKPRRIVELFKKPKKQRELNELFKKSKKQKLVDEKILKKLAKELTDPRSINTGIIEFLEKQGFSKKKLINPLIAYCKEYRRKEVIESGLSFEEFARRNYPNIFLEIKSILIDLAKEKADFLKTIQEEKEEDINNIGLKRFGRYEFFKSEKRVNRKNLISNPRFNEFYSKQEERFLSWLDAKYARNVFFGEKNKTVKNKLNKVITGLNIPQKLVLELIEEIRKNMNN